MTFFNGARGVTFQQGATFNHVNHSSSMYVSGRGIRTIHSDFDRVYRLNVLSSAPTNFATYSNYGNDFSGQTIGYSAYTPSQTRIQQQEREQYRQEREQYRQEREQYRQEREQYRQERERYRQEREGERQERRDQTRQGRRQNLNWTGNNVTILDGVFDGNVHFPGRGYSLNQSARSSHLHPEFRPAYYYSHPDNYLQEMDQLPPDMFEGYTSRDPEILYGPPAPPYNPCSSDQVLEIGPDLREGGGDTGNDDNSEETPLYTEDDMFPIAAYKEEDDAMMM
ncbi:hypothetical protein F5878DRAFT_601686 [Lentinula raphanica]|uniref:Uncharacterized protein n=1 Tax=Lentinula raphanica TaxID=153919 RepID=A0AA38UMT2_9AGAR|nr:hypothetical protein F5878DRAFT_601686 [Lentinula raphanica]